MKSSLETIAVRFVVTLTTLLGGGALALFGVFLFHGSFAVVDLGLSPAEILVWDLTLGVLFCLQHSVMVRQSVRRRFERVFPPHLYGTAYTWASATLLLALVLLWQESPVVVARLEGAGRWVARAIFLGALPGMFWSARSIAHFDPFGVRPVRARLRGREPRPGTFSIRGAYRWVRHPQYFLVLLLLWACPDLTADRLLLNVLLSAWVVLGTTLEERDLVVDFGDRYIQYQRRVPMLIPWRGPAGRD